MGCEALEGKVKGGVDGPMDGWVDWMKGAPSHPGRIQFGFCGEYLAVITTERASHSDRRSRPESWSYRQNFWLRAFVMSKQICYFETNQNKARKHSNKY